VAGPLAAGGCKGKNDSFICLDAKNPVQLALTSYTWEIQFNATSLLPDSQWHLGVRYASADHPDGWILSASSAPIPEPRSTAMFLLGGIVVAAVIRRQVLTAS
jgi:hypothetical protein